ncbi:MAG: hypothetical protein M3Z75_19320 [Actinomycetota bacterium]|nr:hypothetical protein [Actinomycetota bacterium]
MQRTLPDDHAPRRSLRAVVTSLGAVVLFEALTVLETQDKTIRAASPWQDDPYDTVVSLAQFIVPVLVLLIGLRLLAWRQPGGSDRARQTVRAAAVMTALAGLTAACEWAAVAALAHHPSWNGYTGLLITGLTTDSLLVAVAVMLLARCRYPRGCPGAWQHDWLDDVVGACGRLPVVRTWATQRAAAWIRGHAMRVFTAASMVAAAGVTGALAAAERWTSPLLIGWAAVAQTTAFLAFCVISNAIAGFIARPARARVWRVAEAAAVSGGVAIQVTIAFRDAMWHLIRGGPLTSVPELAGLTLGAGVGAAAASVAAAGLLWRLGRQRGAPGRQRCPPDDRIEHQALCVRPMSEERLPCIHPLPAPRPGPSSKPTGCASDTGAGRPSPGSA